MTEVRTVIDRGEKYANVKDIVALLREVAFAPGGRIFGSAAIAGVADGIENKFLKVGKK